MIVLIEDQHERAAPVSPLRNHSGIIPETIGESKMRKVSLLSCVAALAALFFLGARTTNASITGWNCWSTDNSDVSLGDWGFNPGNPAYAYIPITQYAAGEVDSTITTDSDTDPTLTLAELLINDTGFAWSGYTVDVVMANTFTLSSPEVVTPASGWSVSSGGTFADGPNYEDVLTFTGTPPIGIGQDLAFTYTLSFSGLTSFTFDQTFTPIAVPEPASVGVLALGGIALLARRRARA